MVTKQVPSKLLNVSTEASFNDISAQAADVVGAIKDADVCIIMMHAPAPEQLADLQQLSATEGQPVALIGGQFTLMLHVRELLLNTHVVCEAVTDRVAVESTMPDGSVVKKSVFKYCGLRVLN
jgi:hypothetical protein